MTIKDQLEVIVDEAIAAAIAEGALALDEAPAAALERPRDAANGDWASTVAMRSAKLAHANPRAIAQAIVERIPANDVIASCDITGSSDASIKNVVPNDLSPILETAEIRRIYVNGGTASRLYEKYLYPLYERDWVKLPSTSPANAAWSLERLTGSWKRILEDLS